MSKWVYMFGGGRTEGRAGMKDLLGGKGANLAEMAAIGLPVPPGFTITTDVCTFYYANGRTYPAGLEDAIEAGVAHIASVMGASFGDRKQPLLLSVRSGARASMPGMMDTILNLGLNDDTVLGLIETSGDARFAWDSYRRFVQMYSDVVLGIGHHYFEELLEDLKADRGYILDTDLQAGDWKELLGSYKALVMKRSGAPFPDDPYDQLRGAIGAVFSSWMNQRAITYRRLHDIPEAWGTAVNVQAMVFGNMGSDCATGVAFTRDPSTGEDTFFGEYLVNAQGEDVVAGIRTPQHLTILGKQANQSDLPALEELMPDVFRQLDAIRRILEKHYRDMQDIEFTVQRGALWMLQTRTGKRTPAAALKIAVDLAREGLITREEAVMRVDPGQIDQLLHPMLDPRAIRDVLTTGLPASPGAASGKLVFTAADAEAWVRRGEKVILARVETSPEDIGGMHVAEGVLTSRGGMTSHAAVVARGMGRPCVAGAGAVRINVTDRVMTVLGREIREGDLLTLDGSTGQVIYGAVPMVRPDLGKDFSLLMEWADSIRRMGVRANAETPADARVARSFGAEGIGLCRTEHMFFEPGRIVHVRQMILARDEDGRRQALDLLRPYQRADFIEIFRIMHGLPVTIRLLDPPLHEFLPHTDADIQEVADSAGVDVRTVRQAIAQMAESNPMLGHRGCRLGITFPEIYAMQCQAIFEAAIEVPPKDAPSMVEVMIPLVATRRELELTKAIVDQAAKDVFARCGKTIPYKVGTMIELPRAALCAGDLADDAEFFSFGTNDLTQTALGISRDDAAHFMDAYHRHGVYAKDPFVSIDCEGVGELVKIATVRGRAAHPGLKVGVCGEHGGDPDSIDFFEGIGLDYVSCSPYRVPIARLAAARSACRRIGNGHKELADSTA
ncbi:pyruvate, phosphate dikinase [Haematospirillum jordaniae]|uniref:Pyruvate, phosphate dikinase n=1 Tax=Haematospirillum jordaniae TaxID=1549855 RepID=A0A143DFU0_9PROT|nr:pyruvate, phosphate dikinase [Haematospirillum jordaniae]AMW35410.1 pyruvate, phosphate dikinase [Haematospirillum jordaniae]NKD45547.1 pyruvate, phosphate dikinase [Haematospirillum jordaniae]NKD56157.1 pyruvate, phosphate dikinase [Haematospirillum jordaniae]NKD58215.1 pyruvate, phosphate dikinase [Haematospirillum jordaniae]NKD66614.1 pyruvate, phosphate dikinase [Haematospirillum jordaniae]